MPGCSVRRSAIYRSAESDSSDKTRLTQRSTLRSVAAGLLAVPLGYWIFSCRAGSRECGTGYWIFVPSPLDIEYSLPVLAPCSSLDIGYFLRNMKILKLRTQKPEDFLPRNTRIFTKKYQMRWISLPVAISYTA